MRKSKILLLLISLLLIRMIFSGVARSEKKITSPNFIVSKINKIYQSVLPYRDANLLSGIVLGSITLDRSFKASLASVGLSHVVAASGMNVTFVYGIAVWFVTRLKWSKIFNFIGVLAIVAFYTTLTGFDPPIVRAGLMCAFVSIATLIGRESKGWVGLVISGYLMLWVAPSLIINPSFLLSFSSMIGQIFLSTIKVNMPILVSSIVEVFLQSLLAIVFTFPIVIIFFSNFSLISLVTNVLVLWTVEPLMILGSLIASLGFFFTPFAQALSLPAQGLLEYFLGIVDFFSQTKFLTFSFKFSNNFTALMFGVGYYLLLVAIIWKLKNLKPK